MHQAKVSALAMNKKKQPMQPVVNDKTLTEKFNGQKKCGMAGVCEVAAMTDGRRSRCCTEASEITTRWEFQCRAKH